MESTLDGFDIAASTFKFKGGRFYPSIEKICSSLATKEAMIQKRYYGGDPKEVEERVKRVFAAFS